MGVSSGQPALSLWQLILLLSVASGLVVYFRAHRLASPALVEVRGLPWIRRTGAIGCSLSSIAFGIVVGAIYGWLAGVTPNRAWIVLGIAGTACAVVLSVIATLVRRQQGLPGTAELIVLNVLWGCGYGWLVPLVSAPTAPYLIAT